MKQKIVMGLVVSWSLHAFALDFESMGREVGNGGDAIVCYHSGQSIKSVQFYDTYEAEMRYQLKPVYSQKRTLSEKILDLISRLEKLNPSRAFLYRNYFSTFFSESKFVSGVELIDVPDTGSGFYPVGCKIAQVAVQEEPRFSGDKRYTIQRDLWDRMDMNQKAALVVHEIVLREASQFKHESSRETRYMHANILSNAFVKITDSKSYIDFLKSVRFFMADVGGVSTLFTLDALNELRTPGCGFFYLKIKNFIYSKMFDQNHSVLSDECKSTSTKIESAYSEDGLEFYILHGIRIDHSAPFKIGAEKFFGYFQQLHYENNRFRLLGYSQHINFENPSFRHSPSSPSDLMNFSRWSYKDDSSSIHIGYIRSPEFRCLANVQLFDSVQNKWRHLKMMPAIDPAITIKFKLDYTVERLDGGEYCDL